MFKNILTTAVIIFALCLSGAVQAKKAKPISDGEAAKLLTACMKQDDQDNRRASGVFACCSKTLGYCVACPTSDNLGKCVKAPYKEGGPRNLMNQLTAPTAGAAMPPLSKPPTLQQPKATSAPTKAMSPAKTPTVKPIKQYQQNKTPTKAIQTIEK